MIPAPQNPLATEVAAPKEKLEYVKLAPSCGAKVSRVCLGMMSYGDPKWRAWVLPYEQAKPFIARALELGINFFDTADVYSYGESERILGRALRELGVDREQVVIASKVRFDMGGVNRGGLTRKHILHSVDNSLKRLQTDYIDLYQIHRYDNDTPPEETMKALHDVVQSGKVRYIGASSMAAWQFAKLQSVAERNGWTKFVTMQNHYNAVYREEEREMNPLCVDTGVGLIPWSPLARGFLTGNRTVRDKEFAAAETAKNEAAKAAAATATAVVGTATATAATTATAAAPALAAAVASDSKDAKAAAVDAKSGAASAASGPATTRVTSDPFSLTLYYQPEDFAIVDRFVELAKKKGKPTAQLALAWLLHQKGVTSPIFGATKVSHLEDAVAALSIKLDAAELKYLDELYKPHPVLGH